MTAITGKRFEIQWECGHITKHIFARDATHQFVESIRDAALLEDCMECRIQRMANRGVPGSAAIDYQQEASNPFGARAW